MDTITARSYQIHILEKMVLPFMEEQRNLWKF